MQQKCTVALMAALSFAVCVPAVLAQGSSNTEEMSSVSASQMVATRAGLVTNIDAKNAQTGQEFKARLPHKVHLKNGDVLPSGTLLIGKVGQDDMNLNGRSKLVLCINEAMLKDGKTVPVKATIVGVYGPGSDSADGYEEPAGDQDANPWQSGILKIDEIDALHHVDLHSNLNSRNSGVLVSKTDNDIKLRAGTELALAIAEDGNAQQGMNTGAH